MNRKITHVVVPIDLRTGKPRKGRWINRQWCDWNPVPVRLWPQSNPNFEQAYTFHLAPLEAYEGKNLYKGGIAGDAI